MDPFFHTGLSISDSLKTVRKSVLIYETIIHSVTGVTNELTEKIEKLPIKEQKKIIKVIHTLLEE